MILQPVLICSYGAFAAPWPGWKISFDHPVGILTHKSLAAFVPDGIAPDHTATEQNDHRKSDRVREKQNEVFSFYIFDSVVSCAL